MRVHLGLRVAGPGQMPASALATSAEWQSAAAHHPVGMRRDRSPRATNSGLRPRPTLIYVFFSAFLLQAHCSPTVQPTDQRGQVYVVCKDQDSQTCVTWLLALKDENELSNELIPWNRPTEICGLSDLKPIPPHRKFIAVKPFEGSQYTRIFCKNVKIVTEDAYHLADVTGPFTSLYRERRQTGYSLRGRYRGQTQSQYLAIDRGNGKDEGKAEAHSAADSSRASVSGNSGMGQAQSQTIYDPSCDECFGGRNDMEVSNLRRPAQDNYGYDHRAPGHGGIGAPGTHGQGIGGQRMPGQSQGIPGQGGGGGQGLPGQGGVSGHGIPSHGGVGGQGKPGQSGVAGQGMPGQGGIGSGMPQGGMGGNGMPGQGGIGGQGMPGQGGIGGQGMPGQGGIGGQGMPGQGGMGGHGMPSQGGQVGIGGQGMPGQGGIGGHGMPGQGGINGQGIPGQGGMGGHVIPGQGGMGGHVIPGQEVLGGHVIPDQGGIGGQVIPGQGGMGGSSRPGYGQDGIGGLGIPGQGGMGGQVIPGQGGMGGHSIPGQGGMGGQLIPDQGGLGGHGMPGQGGIGAGIPSHVGVGGQAKPGQGGVAGQGMPGQGGIGGGMPQGRIGGNGMPGQGGIGGQVIPGQGGIGGQVIPGQGVSGGQVIPGQGGIGGQIIPGQGGVGSQVMPGQGGIGGQVIPGQRGIGGQVIPGQVIPGQGGIGGQGMPGQGGIGGHGMPGQGGIGGQIIPGQGGTGGQVIPGQGGLGGQGMPSDSQDRTNWPIAAGPIRGPDGLLYYCCVINPNQGLYPNQGSTTGVQTGYPWGSYEQTGGRQGSGAGEQHIPYGQGGNEGTTGGPGYRQTGNTQTPVGPGQQFPYGSGGAGQPSINVPHGPTGTQSPGGTGQQGPSYNYDTGTGTQTLSGPYGLPNTYGLRGNGQQGPNFNYGSDGRGQSGPGETYGPSGNRQQGPNYTYPPGGTGQPNYPQQQGGGSQPTYSGSDQKVPGYNQGVAGQPNVGGTYSQSGGGGQNNGVTSSQPSYGSNGNGQQTQYPYGSGGSGPGGTYVQGNVPQGTGGHNPQQRPYERGGNGYMGGGNKQGPDATYSHTGGVSQRPYDQGGNGQPGLGGTYGPNGGGLQSPSNIGSQNTYQSGGNRPQGGGYGQQGGGYGQQGSSNGQQGGGYGQGSGNGLQEGGNGQQGGGYGQQGGGYDQGGGNGQPGGGYGQQGSGYGQQGGNGQQGGGYGQQGGGNGQQGGGYGQQGGGYGQEQGGQEQGTVPNGDHIGEPQNVLDPNSIIGDDDDSQALASVYQGANGTTASASSQGGNDKGHAQTNVQGTYTDSGSFSAQASISDDNKGAESQVSGSKKGASSNAEGRGRKNKSQAAVKLGSETGSIQTESQSGGNMHSSSTQVQGSVKGGVADAQARGPGSTSSQAQIGFTPYKEGDKEHELLKTPFEGGGTASAQSSGRMGTSQSQLRGTFKYGITYNGAAQAGASLDKDAVFSNFTPFEKIDVFDQNNTNINVNAENTERPLAIDLPPDTSANEGPEKSDDKTIQDSNVNYEGHSHYDHHRTKEEINTTSVLPLPSNRRAFSTPYGNNNNGGDYDYNVDDTPPDEYDVEEVPDGAEGIPSEYTGYDNYGRDTENTHQSQRQLSSSRKGLEVKQTTGGNTQHILIGSLKNQDAKITQIKSEHPDESKVYQPGERVPGMGGYIIPAGFTGSVKSVSSKEKTYVVGTRHSPSQAQTVTLTPGTGKVKYAYPERYGKNNVNPKDLRSLYNPRPDDNRYVSVSKSVTRDLDSENNIRKQYSHTYYTKSSSCGYFTFTCTMVSSAEGKKKVCRPKIPTNPDGTPMRC